MQLRLYCNDRNDIQGFLIAKAAEADYYSEMFLSIYLVLHIQVELLIVNHNTSSFLWLLNLC